MIIIWITNISLCTDGVQLSFRDFIDLNKKLYTKNGMNLVELVDNYNISGNKYQVKLDSGGVCDPHLNPS